MSDSLFAPIKKPIPFTDHNIQLVIKDDFKKEDALNELIDRVSRDIVCTSIICSL
jgi:hypothetical protein